MKTALLITLLVSFASASLAQDSSAAQKKEFIDLLKTLPSFDTTSEEPNTIRLIAQTRLRGKAKSK